MNDQEILKKQLVNHFINNWLIFVGIFSIFGIMVIIMFNTITYNSLDKELKEEAQVFLEEQSMMNAVSDFFSTRNFLIQNNEDINKQLQDIRDYNLSRKIKNPKYTVIVRDSSFNIINSSDLGSMYNEYKTEIFFDSSNLDNVYNLKIGNKFNYRAINVKLDSEKKDNVRYIQLLVNSENEKILAETFKNIIISSIVAGVFFSLIASYYLAKKNLIPIAETMVKQTEFVQNASHELRTPLTIIQTKQEMLLREPNAKIIDKSEDIVLSLNETKRLAKLTKDLMTLATDKMVLEKENVAIDELIKNTLKPYEELVVLEEKELRLELQYEREINLDVNKFKQVLIILLDNSMKYTEKGDSITIATFLKDGKCNIEVRDTGIGISDNGLKEVFTRFYREDKARNRETGGSGLGLSIADSIVKAHGGTIKASHNEPKGTIFTIKLPK